MWTYRPHALELVELTTAPRPNIFSRPAHPGDSDNNNSSSNNNNNNGMGLIDVLIGDVRYRTVIGLAAGFLVLLLLCLVLIILYRVYCMPKWELFVAVAEGTRQRRGSVVTGVDAKGRRSSASIFSRRKNRAAEEGRGGASGLPPQQRRRTVAFAVAPSTAPSATASVPGSNTRRAVVGARRGVGPLEDETPQHTPPHGSGGDLAESPRRQAEAIRIDRARAAAASTGGPANSPPLSSAPHHRTQRGRDDATEEEGGSGRRGGEAAYDSSPSDLDLIEMDALTAGTTGTAAGVATAEGEGGEEEARVWPPPPPPVLHSLEERWGGSASDGSVGSEHARGGGAGIGEEGPPLYDSSDSSSSFFSSDLDTGSEADSGTDGWGRSAGASYLFTWGNDAYDVDGTARLTSPLSGSSSSFASLGAGVRGSSRRRRSGPSYLLPSASGGNSNSNNNNNSSGNGGGDDRQQQQQQRAKARGRSERPTPTTTSGGGGGGGGARRTTNLWQATFRQLVGSTRHSAHNMSAIHAILSVPISLILENPLVNEELEVDPLRWPAAQRRRELLHSLLPDLFTKAAPETVGGVLEGSSSSHEDNRESERDGAGAGAVEGQQRPSHSPLSAGDEARQCKQRPPMEMSASAVAAVSQLGDGDLLRGPRSPNNEESYLASSAGRVGTAEKTDDAVEDTAAARSESLPLHGRRSPRTSTPTGGDQLNHPHQKSPGEAQSGALSAEGPSQRSLHKREQPQQQPDQGLRVARSESAGLLPLSQGLDDTLVERRNSFRSLSASRTTDRGAPSTRQPRPHSHAAHASPGPTLHGDKNSASRRAATTGPATLQANMSNPSFSNWALLRTYRHHDPSFSNLASDPAAQLTALQQQQRLLTGGASFALPADAQIVNGWLRGRTQPSQQQQQQHPHPPPMKRKSGSGRAGAGPPGRPATAAPGGRGVVGAGTPQRMTLPREHLQLGRSAESIAGSATALDEISVSGTIRRPVMSLPHPSGLSATSREEQQTQQSQEQQHQEQQQQQQQQQQGPQQAAAPVVTVPSLTLYPDVLASPNSASSSVSPREERDSDSA